jgi:hypothetical protein
MVINEIVKEYEFKVIANKICSYLNNAKNAKSTEKYLEAEGKLIKKVIKTKSQFSEIPFNKLSKELQNNLREAVEWLTYKGRDIDLSNPDPEKWVSEVKRLSVW